jgi:hypothetical protein
MDTMMDPLDALCRMKVRVQLYIAGKIFYEDIIAANYKDGRETALARNPKAKVISVTAIF